MNHKLSAGTLDRLWADDSHWRAGVIYWCKDDPRLVVPKRYWKWGGWTMNFAHASAWLLLLAIIVAATIPAGILAAAQVRDVWLWVAYVAGITVFACVVSAILASPKRYENAG
jgi:Family of unknown function (DUF5808)